METQSKILIIDDEEIVLDSCQQILAGSGEIEGLAELGSRQEPHRDQGQDERAHQGQEHTRHGIGEEARFE